MNTITKAAAVVAAGFALALAPAMFASADDAPTPDPTATTVALPDLPDATWADDLPGVLDCDLAQIHFVTVHYVASFNGYDDASQPVYGDWVEVSRSTVNGYATGDAPESDCPNWTTEGTGIWHSKTLVITTADDGTVTYSPVSTDEPADTPVVDGPAVETVALVTFDAISRGAMLWVIY